LQRGTAQHFGLVEKSCQPFLQPYLFFFLTCVFVTLPLALKLVDLNKK
jgi:hypothetical protein